MAEDTPQDPTGITPDKIAKISVSIAKWFIGILICLGLFAGLFWALFYSTYFASFSFIIPLRNFYQESYWKTAGIVLAKKTYPPVDPIYIIQPQKPLQSGLNTYTFVGTFSKIDTDSALIYLKGPDQKEYIFRTGDMMRSDKDIWLVIIKVSSVQKLSSVLFPGSGTSYRQTLVKDNIPSNPPTLLGVRWNDTMTISQIEKAHGDNPEIPLNQEFPKSLILAEFK